jgi:hypothetical protein
MKNIKLSLGIVDPNETKSDESFLINILYEMFPEEETKFFTKGQYFVIWNSFIDPADNKKYVNQSEFPLQTLPWFIDTLEDKFWNHENDANSLPGDVSESTVIEGEKIGINPMRHCCAENLFGYSFWNSSRRSYLSKRSHHNWQIPRYMLEEGLLDKLKNISTQLGLKRYSL